MADNKSKNIIDTLEDFFKKAPAIPANGREALVKITPWLAIIFGILGVLGGLAGVGILTMFSPLAAFSGAQGIASYGTGIIAAWIWLASSVLMVLAYPGLKARKIGGWNWLFWSEVLNIVGSVVAGSLINAVIGALIGFYLLFQIKSYYK
ncbi:MAG TPA: hypothetical protein VNA13_03305 [Xanthomonadales bacterium]|nr:hypothetical protein [Xanthomonadales bacterium]